MKIILYVAISLFLIGAIFLVTSSLLSKKNKVPSFISIWKKTIMPIVLFVGFPIVLIATMIFANVISINFAIYFGFTALIAYYASTFIVVVIQGKKIITKYNEEKNN